MIVTDGESAMSKAVESIIPEWKLVTCWNHILTDLEVWLKKKYASVDEISVYKSNVREMLQYEIKHSSR